MITKFILSFKEHLQSFGKFIAWKHSDRESVSELSGYGITSLAPSCVREQDIFTPHIYVTGQYKGNNCSIPA